MPGLTAVSSTPSQSDAGSDASLRLNTRGSAVGLSDRRRIRQGVMDQHVEVERLHAHARLCSCRLFFPCATTSAFDTAMALILSKPTGQMWRLSLQATPAAQRLQENFQRLASFTLWHSKQLRRHAPSCFCLSPTSKVVLTTPSLPPLVCCSAFPSFPVSLSYRPEWHTVVRASLSFTPNSARRLPASRYYFHSSSSVSCC